MKTIAAPLLATALLVAACGGDDGGSDVTDDETAPATTEATSASDDADDGASDDRSPGVGSAAIWQDFGGGLGQFVALGDDYYVGVTLVSGGQAAGQAIATSMLAAL